MNKIKELGLELSSIQRELHAMGKNVLIIFEGLDGAGKGTTINKVLQFLDPRGYKVYTNERKNEEQKLRPFMWKYWNQTPGRGEISILDRSWYYELFIKSYNKKLGKNKYNETIEIIEDTEKMLIDNGTIIIKIFLHIEKDVQKTRLKTLDNNKNTSWRVDKKDFKMNNDYDSVYKLYNLIINSTTLPFYEGDTTKETFLEDLFSYIIKQLKTFKSPFDKDIIDIKEESIDWMKYNVIYEIEDDYYEKLLKKYQNRLRTLQHMLYDKRIPLIIAFEGHDGAGKGGTIKRLVEGLDPRGYDVIPVSAPNDIEKSNHYLWRFWKNLPKNGHIGIFDRSWYGRVLVEKVEGFCSELEWKRAYDEINKMEEQWVFDKAIVVKYFITISKEEQLKRFEDRKLNKNWKITEEDWRNREKWDQYENAISTMLNLTNKPHAPWVVIPNNNKLFGRLEVLKSLIDIVENRLKL